MSKKLLLSFPSDVARVAGQNASSLETSLKKQASIDGVQIETTIERENPDAMDLGTIVGIIFASSATIAIAKGIADWMRRNNQTHVKVSDENGRDVEIRNADSADIATALEAIYSKP